MKGWITRGVRFAFVNGTEGVAHLFAIWVETKVSATGFAHSVRLERWSDGLWHHTTQQGFATLREAAEDVVFGRTT